MTGNTNGIDPDFSYFDGSIGREPAPGEVQAKRPVEAVSWYYALVFCNRLSISEGLSPAYSINGSTDPDAWGAVPTISNATWNAAIMVAGSNGYRLPTEAQWEYACKAGKETLHWWGIDGADADPYTWYKGNSNDMTHQVGLKIPNAFGLYDMAGNVWEWCWDWFGSYPGGNYTDYLGPSTGSQRIVRGGCYGWRAAPSSYRHKIDPSSQPGNFGFRVVRP